MSVYYETDSFKLFNSNKLCVSIIPDQLGHRKGIVFMFKIWSLTGKLILVCWKLKI